MERLRVRPLTVAERQTLMHWLKNESASPALTRRARVILLSSYGISTYLLAALIPMGRTNIAHWIRRFDKEGLNGLRDRPRSGRPRRRDRPSNAEGAHDEVD
jgi:transposase